MTFHFTKIVLQKYSKHTNKAHNESSRVLLPHPNHPLVMQKYLNPESKPFFPKSKFIYFNFAFQLQMSLINLKHYTNSFINLNYYYYLN